MNPIVFLHGFLGRPSDWEGVISHLPPCLCITPELPGHGKTPFSALFSIEVPSQKFHLVGYSMGGRLALQYARQYPERIDSLTILSAHPGLNSIEEKQNRLLHDQTWAEKLKTLPIDQFLFEWYNQPLFASFKPDFAMRRDHDPEALGKALVFYSLAFQPFYKPETALYLVGGKDEKYRALYPEAHIIERAGHMIHLENPKEVAKQIEQRIFL